MKLRSHLAIWISMVAMYAGVVLLGLGYISLPRLGDKPRVWSDWQAPDPNAIPSGPAGDRIRYGIHLFNETPWYAAKYVGDKLRCSDCHVAGGIAPYAIPLVGMTKIYPTYNKRAGRVISLQERIQQCFVRSENGRPLPEGGREMDALVAYLQWLSQPEPAHRPFQGRGLMELPPLRPDAGRGAQIYAAQCAGCHGADGAGSLPLMPPLWGPDSFNDGAGMNQVAKMARFVQYNMPQNRRGSLSAQDAYDVAAFLHTMPRPKFNPAYKKY